MNFVVYILFSASLGKYYVGQTQDLEVRLQQHNSGRGKFTSTGAPWAVVHQQTFATRAEAVRLETTIKKRGIRRYLEAV